MINLPIDTDRLRIRHFKKEDLHSYLRFMLDEESTKFLAFEATDKTEDGATKLFHLISQSYCTNEPIHAFAIEDLRSGNYLGSCGFAPYDEGVLECYYCVDTKHRRTGVAVEATSALLKALGPIAEVKAFCHIDNISAHLVAQKCGMKLLGKGRNKNTGLKGYVFVQPRS